MIKNIVSKISKKDFLKLKEEYIDLLNKEDFYIQYIDGKLIQTQQQCYDYFGKVYCFANYFGNNWDAFTDCMRDLEFWDESQGFILVIYNYSNFLSQYQKDKQIFIECLKYIVYFYEKECLTTSGGMNKIKSFDVYLIDEDINM